MSLVVTDLACRRAGRRVLDGVAFALADGATLVLRGPNGAGKSTLLRTLAGLLPPERGRATLDGVSLGEDPDGWTERIAYAGHLDAVKGQLTVTENLRFWAAMLGARSGAAEAALDAFALAPIGGRLAGACSAGQRRRLGLARLALAPRRLWLLDEPTVSLDADATGRLAGLIDAHAARGGITVVATHVVLGVQGAELRLSPPAVATAAAADPFLA